MSTLSPLQEAVNNYHRQGYSTIPVGPDKRPRLPSWAAYQRRRPTVQEMRQWFSNPAPDTGVAIVCGAVSGGLAVIDIDDKTLAAALGDDTALRSETTLVRSQHGGLHVYLRETSGRSRSGPLVSADGRKVGDLKAEGGYVVAPPSPGYTLLADNPPKAVENARLYAAELLRAFDVELRPPGTLTSSNGDHPDVHLDGWEDVDLEAALHKALAHLSRGEQARLVGILSDPDAYDNRYPSPSEKDFSVLCTLLRGGLTDAEALAVWLNNPLGERQKTQQRDDYVQLTLRRARAAVGRNGATPDQEIVSPTYREEVVGEKKFLPATELAARAPQAIRYVLEPWLVRGAITLLSGKPKLSGKTTLVLHMAKAVLEGHEFLGKTADLRGPVIFLTEERQTSFVDALRRSGLDTCDHLLIRRYSPDDAWADVAAAALAEARRVGAPLLIVDTLPQFAGLTGDLENAAGEARVALLPFAGVDDLAVAVNFHDRKSGGELGDSIRGSSAYAGAVDIIIDLRRVAGDSQSHRREIAGVGRFEVPDKVLIELTEDGYRLLGDAQAVAREDAKVAIGNVLGALAGKALTEDALREELPDLKKSTLGGALREMLRDGEVERTGTGRRGDAFQYFVSPTTPPLRVGERKNPGGNGHLVQAAIAMGARPLGEE